ncbi:hypothetical protein TNCV_4136551 [Trichonephila clavipes]|nr:hypothetical protein TNCV_4136551 [Trichonephila clavipes]
MALATLSTISCQKYRLPRRRRNRPVMLNLWICWKTKWIKKVDKLFVNCQLRCWIWETLSKTTAEKRKADAVCFYEPKSKVQILSKDDKFQVKLDTSNYQPDEITVKVINDRIAISAKHESRGDDVYEYHEMTRSFDLPEGVDPATVVSRLNTSGQLTIEAPMKHTERGYSRKSHSRRDVQGFTEEGCI